MPYIKEENREVLDRAIGGAVETIKSNIEKSFGDNLSDSEFMEISGDINYFVSRITCQLMGDVSYKKIAIITGVLENIKQEFYRRVASPYEDMKILQNGDIKEYLRFKNG